MPKVLNNSIYNRSRKGFTLSEVLISVALMAFVGTAAIGGIAILFREREKIDKQSKAEMVMIATVSYLRADLNCVTNPSNMDCSPSNYSIESNAPNTFGPVFFSIDPAYGRYSAILIKDSTGNTIASATGISPSVQFWNSTSGICVGVKYSGKPVTTNGSDGPTQYRKYILAQNVMADTGMYTMIGGDDSLAVGTIPTQADINSMDQSIKYKDYLFTCYVYVLDSTTNEVIMKQKVEVCPEPVMPTVTNNP